MPSPNQSLLKQNLINNQNSLLAYIQCLMLQQKPIFDAYKEFYNLLGDDAMAYRDFDFWWYRFENGLFDMDYDRSQDKKKPELSDIPLDLIKEILENLEWKERCVFRNVSKSCRSLVDHQPYTFNSLELTNAYYNSQLYQYQGELGNISFEDLCLAFKNPNVKFKELIVKLDNSQLDSLHHILNSQRHQIHVETLIMDVDFRSHFNLRQYNVTYYGYFLDETRQNLYYGFIAEYPSIQKYALKILPHLKPGILQTIDLAYQPSTGVETETIPMMQLNAISGIEQWKKAKQLITNFDVSNPIGHFFHFNRIDLFINDFETKHADIIRYLASKSPNFKSCRLTFRRNCYQLNALLGVESIPITENGLFIDGDLDYVYFEKI